MLVSPTTLELAFWRILHDRRAETGTPLPFGELEQEWDKTGLRRSDLRDAVRMTLERGWVECVPESAGLALRLTSGGYRRFYQPTALSVSLALYDENERVLDEVRQRPHAGNAPERPQRRASDLNLED